MKKQKLPPFVPMFVYVMDSPAWLAMSPGARAFFLAFKKRYSRKTQQAVFLSVRVAAKELGADKGTVSRWCRELQHFGFIVEVRGASFGPGRGTAAEFRLTDERYKGKPPSMDFTCWDGTSFCDLPYAKPVRKPGFPYAKSGHSRTQNAYGKPGNAQNSRTQNAYTSRRRSSHLSAEERHSQRGKAGPRGRHDLRVQ